ncbi:MAG TPA: BT_3928 family protein [Chitinophagaceae bacterium]|jgi:uncharacterized membrane protein YphA (DoxX/SURF4 family)|nr:BT_3928 family protein [Chitinophagaceae bacterium]
MKLVLNITRVIVGVLFIFSGLVKANDPLGLSYKMKEFFEKWNEGLSHGSFFLKDILINFFQFFHDRSLSLSVFMIAFEIIGGVALLLGWRMKIFSWLLLLLIVFFTFLTGYAFLSGKFTNCGCFGDCLPISPKASFLKDIALTALIILLFINRKKINPYFSGKTNFVVMMAATVISFGLQWYVLTYLPFVDCLPFKKGNNISEKRKMPANAIPDSTVINFVYEKEGKKVEFTADKFPSDFKVPPYKFITRYDKLIRKGKNNEPPIKGFSLKTPSGVDSTDIVLSEPLCLLLFCEDFSTPVKYWQKDFEGLKKIADQKNIPIYIVTASSSEAKMALDKTNFADIPIFECDFTAIRTAARTNPCLYLLKQGTVVNKWSYERISDAKKHLP